MTNLDRLSKARLAVRAALELKAEEPSALDMRELTTIADTFVIVTGNSDRHVRAIADSVENALREADERPFGVEGYEEGSWVLIDCSDLIVHVFLPDVRERYDLERLWSDAPALDLGSDAPPEPVHGSGS